METGKRADVQKHDVETKELLFESVDAMVAANVNFRDFVSAKGKGVNAVAEVFEKYAPVCELFNQVKEVYALNNHKNVRNSGFNVQK